MKNNAASQQAPILSKFFRSNTQDLLPPAAKSPNECIVEPTKGERIDGAPYWGFQNLTTCGGDNGNSCNKRKHDNNSASSSNNDYKQWQSTFEHGIATFLSSGCCMIPNALPTKFVEQSREKATGDLEFLQAERNDRLREAVQTNQQHLMAAVQRGDSRELVERDGGRIDIRFQLDRFPFTCPGLVYNPIVFPLVRELLGGGNEINLLYAGIMWAISPKDISSEACHQKWHGDGGHLFEHTHLPPHCINVFYPLVDLTLENGTTEFQPGTHRLGHFDSVTDQFAFACDAGSAILFDYRLKHRGRSNSTSQPRPVLYLAYAKPFFRDAGNLRSGQSLVSSKRPSPPWVARILSGQPMKMRKGFENNDKLKATTTETNKNGDDSARQTHKQEDAVPVLGSGERWVLFRMNVELPNGDSPTLVVHHGDVASEISSQFCLENTIDDEYVSVLTDTIQQQIDAYKLHMKQTRAEQGPALAPSL